MGVAPNLPYCVPRLLESLLHQDARYRVNLVPLLVILLLHERPGDEGGAPNRVHLQDSLSGTAGAGGALSRSTV
jgi:hypothetical protein